MQHGIDDRRGRRDRTGLSAALDTQEVMRRRRHDVIEFKVRNARHIVGTWHAIVHESPRQELGAVRIVDAVFEQGLADALSRTAMDLTFDDHRIDHVAEIVHDGVGDDVRRAGFRIDLQFAQV